MNKDVMKFEGKQIKLTKAEYDTFVGSISTQNPTPEEINLHLWYCDSKGVNPLDKLIFFTKRQGRYVPITSIDYMRIRAESSNVYAGSDDPEFFYSKEDKKGTLIHSAKVTVWKMVGGQRCSFSATARWSEYAPANIDDKAAFLWRKMPHVMLGKCAEALALRKAFPGQLHGLYVTEELAQDGRFVAELQDQNAEQGDLKPVEGEVAPSEDSTPVDEQYPKPESIGAVAVAESLAKSYTKSQLKSHLVVEIQDALNISGKELKTIEIINFINKLPDGKYTIGQVVQKLGE